MIRARRGCRSNCAQSSISLLSEGGPLANIWHLSSMVLHYCSFQKKKKIISVHQIAFLLMDSRRMPSQPDVLLGNSPLCEYMYPLIPFHASPLSLSLSGEENSPQAEVHSCLEEWQQHREATMKVINPYSVTAMVSRVLPSNRIHRKTTSPSTLGFWEINTCIHNAFKKQFIQLWHVCMYSDWLILVLPM